MNHPSVTLRYFNARGRAQFLRYYLSVRNIPFDDERVSIGNGGAEWFAIKPDESLTGPFHKLPVLHWGERQIAETLVIAAFLHREVGDAALLSDEENLRHEMLISSLYNDVVLPVGMMIWAPAMYEGMKLEVAVPKSFARITAHLSVLDSLLGEWQWSQKMQRRPILLADCLLWEEIDVLLTIFGSHVALDTLPALEAFHERYRSGTAFEEILKQHPCQFTGMPNEPETIEAIREVLSSAAASDA